MKLPRPPAHDYTTLTRDLYSPEMRARMDARRKRRLKAEQREKALRAKFFAQLCTDALIGQKARTSGAARWGDAALRQSIWRAVQRLYDEIIEHNPEIKRMSACDVVAKQLGGVHKQTIYDHTEDPRPKYCKNKS